jgi:hypothetical protein
MKRTVWMMIGAGALATASGASADVVRTLGFTRITANAAENIASQLTVEVRAAALNSTYADFTFRNLIGVGSEVTEIYFDDGSLFGISTVSQGNTAMGTTPTFHTGGVNPGNLPGSSGLATPFVTSAGFAVDSDVSGPSPDDGLDEAADWLTIRFDLLPGKTFQDTLSALDLPLPHTLSPDNWLRIGMHVRSIGSNAQSDGFVNTVTVIPLPPAAWAGLGSLACVAGLSAVRRRRNAVM